MNHDTVNHVYIPPSHPSPYAADGKSFIYVFENVGVNGAVAIRINEFTVHPKSQIVVCDDNIGSNAYDKITILSLSKKKHSSKSISVYSKSGVLLVSTCMSNGTQLVQLLFK